MPKLIEISLEEILKKKELTNQQYILKERERAGDGRLLEAEFKFKANSNGDIYVGSKKVDTHEEKIIKIDKNGFVYYEKYLGPIKYNIYEEIFLGNTCLGAAIGGLNSRLIDEVRNIVKDKSHFIYRKFEEKIEYVSKNYSNIEQALKRKKYFKDKSELKKFSELDIDIFRAIKKKEDESTIFREWYIDYLISNGYQKKIEDPWKKSSLKLKQWVNKLSEKLESKGFQKVNSLSYN